jgi:Zn-dependent M16 (insulinase) family peptidase
MHPLFTNGISYVDLAFPVDTFDPSDYIWLPFFSRTVSAMGLPGMKYGEVSTLMAKTAGGFYAMLHSASKTPSSASAAALPTGILDIVGRDWIVFRLKALDEKLEASLNLAFDLITKADYSDLSRLNDLVLEVRNDFVSSLGPSGHHYASSRSSRSFSRSRTIDDIWSGLDQILFAYELTNVDISEISAKLKSIQEKISSAGLLVNLASGSPAKAEKEIGWRFGLFGSPKARNPRAMDTENFSKTPTGGGGRGEVFASSSLQIGFASISHKAAPYGSAAQAAELVFAHQLSTGALWENIRMKGGAYGAFAHPDHLEGSFGFSTYRDPNPLRSLDAFSAIIEEEAAINEGLAGSNSSIDKAVIGTYAKEIRPRTPSDKSITDFFRFLYGIEEEHRMRRLRAIIEVSPAEIAAVCRGLAGEKGPLYPVIIAGKSEAEKAALKLGVPVKELPM